MGLIIESFYLSLFSNSLSTSCEDIRATLDKYEPLFLYFSKRLENVDELPLTIKNTPEEAFIETYQECQKICELQYFDKIFKKAFLEYSQIKNYNFLKNLWIKKYSKLIDEDYTTFLLDYLDYDQFNGDLQLHFRNFNSKFLFIPRIEFSNTIKIIEFLNNLNKNNSGQHRFIANKRLL